MRTVADLRSLRAAVQAWKKEGLRVGLVPTMGNLHAGHFSLVELARKHADRVVVSVFVNPTQFGPDEDYTRYPRTLAEDSVGLVEHQCDLLFVPNVETMYPAGPEHALRIHVPEVGDTLEGAHRPGHFDGVATVVAKLLSMVDPDVAVFGAKDWQQTRVVRRLVRELALSAWSVALAVLRPRLDIRPAMVAFPLRLKRDFEIALLANCITLTPGTLSVDVSEDRRFLHVHALDCRDPQDLCRSIAETFERRIMEAFP